MKGRNMRPTKFKLNRGGQRVLTAPPLLFCAHSGVYAPLSLPRGLGGFGRARGVASLRPQSKGNARLSSQLNIQLNPHIQLKPEPAPVRSDLSAFRYISTAGRLV